MIGAADAFEPRTAFALTAACLACTMLVRLHVSHRRRVKSSRAAAFDGCTGALSSCRIVQDDVDYPVLTGEYRARSIELRLIADHVGYRKVPSLWLQVTLFAELPGFGVLDYLVRPQNIEFYSPAESLPVELPVPAHWPQHATLKCDRSGELPPVAALDPVLRLFDEPEMKELLVTSRGVRLVRQVDQAERREYLVLRAVQFAEDRIDAADLHRLLDALIPLANTLERSLAASRATGAPAEATKALLLGT